MTSWESPRQVTLHARVAVGLALESAKSFGSSAIQSRKNEEPRLETSASCLPFGETSASRTPLPGVSMSVRKWPLVQSAGSVEKDGFLSLTFQRTIPKIPSPAGFLTPTPSSERPLVAQCRWRVTANDGSLTQLTSVLSATCAKQR